MVTPPDSRMEISRLTSPLAPKAMETIELSSITNSDGTLRFVSFEMQKSRNAPVADRAGKVIAPCACLRLRRRGRGFRLLDRVAEVQTVGISLKAVGGIVFMEKEEAQLHPSAHEDEPSLCSDSVYLNVKRGISDAARIGD